MGELKQRLEQGITPHSIIIPSISERLPVKEHQKPMIHAIREALGLPIVITDEQINYQLSWCKWMAHSGHNSVYASLEAVKDHLRQQFLSDEGVANVIRNASQTQV